MRRSPADRTLPFIDSEAFLRRAIALGVASVDSGRGGPFGAVIVRDGAIIGEGANSVTSTCDPTAHAEVLAIRAACGAEKSFALPGAIIFASSEPCPMCLAAIYWARIESIYFATGRAEAARAGFDDALFYDELSKGMTERGVPIRQIELPEGRHLFERWRNKSDKVPY